MLQFLLLLGELVLTAGLRRSMSSAVSCCWIGSAKDTRLDYKESKATKIVTLTKKHKFESIAKG